MDFQQTFVMGAFEATDQGKFEYAVERVERATERMQKKKGQGRPAQKEQSALKDASKKLLHIALAVARRPQHQAPKDSSKPNLGRASLKAARALFVYVDDHKTIKTIHGGTFQSLVDNFIEAVQTDGVDFNAIEIDNTPALAFENENDDDHLDIKLFDEEKILAVGRDLDRSSPPLSDAAEYEVGSKGSDREIVHELEWPHQLDMEDFENDAMEGVSNSSADGTRGNEDMDKDMDEEMNVEMNVEMDEEMDGGGWR